MYKSRIAVSIFAAAFGVLLFAGCATQYYTDGESVAYGTDIYSQRKFAGKVQTPKGLYFEGESTRRVDAEGIEATGNAVSKVIDSALANQVAAGKIKADVAAKLAEILKSETKRVIIQPK